MYDAAGSGEQVVVTLPASGPAGTWSALGSSGYRFRSRSTSAAVSSVTVRLDRITVKGGTSAFTYTLDEPSQGQLALRLGLGSDRPWCAAAPGRVDHVGHFVAESHSPPPAVCPAVP